MEFLENPTTAAVKTTAHRYQGRPVLERKLGLVVIAVPPTEIAAVAPRCNMPGVRT